MNWLLRRLLALWVQFRVRPENAAAQLQGRNHPVCYVLERRSVTDLAVLQAACLALKLPRPNRPLGSGLPEPRSYFYLSQPRSFWSTRPAARPPAQLAHMIRVLRADPEADFDLVPVAVYWGRAPQREASWLRLLLVEDWVLTTRLQKFLQVLFNGRDTLVELDEPMSLRELLGADLKLAQRGRRVTRTLRALYARRRAARIGPDLSHRRTIVNEVLRTRAVRAAVAQEMRAKKLTRRRAVLRARADALEIAANYSPRLRALHGARADAAVEPPVRRRGIRSRTHAGAGRRGERDHLRALPPQPHGLPAARLRDLRAGLCGAAHRRRE